MVDGRPFYDVTGEGRVSKVPGSGPMRCRVHTHACHRPFMSHIDICQMYALEDDIYSFSIVISPRTQGLKLLVVRLTAEGKKEIKQYYDVNKLIQQGRQLDVRQYVLEQINTSNTKFYYQVPFRLSEDP